MLLDTSGLFLAHHQSEPQHLEAARLFHTAPLRLTHSYVLAEFVALIHARRLPRRGALAFEAALRVSPAVDVVFVDELLHKAAADLLSQRVDKDWSLCDAVSFVLMQARGLREALTTDHHFEQAGFVRLLRP